MSEYWREVLFWTTLAVGITLFVAGFLPLFKLAASHLPASGLTEALAAGA